MRSGVAELTFLSLEGGVAILNWALYYYYWATSCHHMHHCVRVCKKNFEDSSQNFVRMGHLMAAILKKILVEIHPAVSELWAKTFYRLTYKTILKIYPLKIFHPPNTFHKKYDPPPTPPLCTVKWPLRGKITVLST